MHRNMIGFFFLLVFTSIASSLQAADTYKGPSWLTATKDGTKLFIVQFDADEIAVLNVADDSIRQTIPVGKEPRSAFLSGDEKILYVTSGGYSGKLQAVDLASGKVVKEVPAGHTPVGGTLSPDGKKLYICNRFSAEVAQYDLPEMNLVRTFKVIREPCGAVVTPDGKKLIVINAMPNDPTNFPEDEDAMLDVAAEVSVIDLDSGESKKIRLPNGSGSINSVCISPDGRYVYLTEILARFQMPTTQLERGWMNTNGISIIDTTKLDDKRNGFVNTVLLDDSDKGASNPHGIAISADGRKLFVAIAGNSELIVVDAEAMHAKLDSLPVDDLDGISSGAGSSAKSSGDVPNDLAFLVGMKQRVNLEGKGARAVAVIGNHVYVGMYFHDTLQKIDLSAPGRPRVGEIALGPKPKMTRERLGEMHWNDAMLCFQQWQSCASCHPDARMDAYNWDLLNDGMGNPKNTKSLVHCHECGPAMWSGVRASSQVCTRTGFKHILFTEPDEEKCQDIDAFVGSLKPVPSPYLVDGQLSERALRGKQIFDDPKIGCVKCHPGPLYTDQKMHNVKTRCYYDERDDFDTPSLIECWRTAPYMHDGRYATMREVFKDGLHGDILGPVGSLTDTQIDDLCEYILSL